MTGTQLRAFLSRLELSQVAFARLVGVTTRAVTMWLSDEREIPGPVRAYVGLFEAAPVALRQIELARVIEGTTQMKDGFYQVNYNLAGVPTSAGFATLVFDGGRIYGVDTEGGQYDGDYAVAEDSRADVAVKVTLPANAMSIFGIRNPYEWSINIATRLDPKAEAGDLLVSTSLGPKVNAHYRYLRGLPN